MKRTTFSALLLLILMAGCHLKSGDPGNQEAVSADPVKTDNHWELFWKSFQQSVMADDQQGVAQLCQFPMKGIYPWIDGRDVLTVDKFYQGYQGLFNELTKAKIMELSPDQVIQTQVAGQEQSLFFELPEGSELRTFQVDYSYEKESGEKINTSYSYYFGKPGDQYRLLAVTFFLVFSATTIPGLTFAGLGFSGYF